MIRGPTWLLEHRRDVDPQTGEDGVIEKILEVIPEHDKWCVEFGAWDGVFLTNTRNLIESQGYSAVLIEADKAHFHALQQNYAQHANVTTMNRRVGFGQADGLDSILGTTRVPREFDFLSIDIDGNDYHVWRAISHYRPKVVLIEFNPTIPTPVRFVQPADPSVSQGASLLSLVELGKEKGYELVAVLQWNAFFVRSEYYPLFEVGSNAPEVLRTNLDAVTYLFSGYDGKVFLRGYCRLPWHKFPLSESCVQHLPWFLRRCPDSYTWLQRQAFAAFVLVRNVAVGVRWAIRGTARRFLGRSR